MYTKTFEVRDFRTKQFFMVDDAYLNGYAKHLDPTTTAVYLSLCRHSDKEQQSFPSQDLIAKEHGISKSTVKRKIRKLLGLNIIDVSQARNNKGKWLHNTYILLDKSVWKTIGGSPVTHGNGGSPMTHTGDHPRPLKDTHVEGNTLHSIEAKKFSSLKEITEEDMEEISNRYKIPLGMVRLSYEKLVNYCESKGKRYKNYKAALRNFVLGDAKKEIERRQYGSNKRGIDARNIQ